MKIYNNATELIGKTPLLMLSRFMSVHSLKAEVIAKLEYLNPAGSVKDRVALAMINEVEKNGLLKKGSVIIEPTSGNTGIGLAFVAVPKGYRLILTMPESMSAERRALLKAYGAEIVLTPADKGMSGAIEKAEELSREIPDSFIPSQFENPANPAAHKATTGVEIWEDTDGTADIFVAGVGTGGTLTGTALYLKEKNPDIRIVAVEPFDSPVISEGKAAPHALQGIGANFIPKTLDTSVIDEVITVKTEEAYTAARELVKYEGILSGISSGAALHAAKTLAQREENAGKKIVVLLPDTGDRYLSTPLFEEN